MIHYDDHNAGKVEKAINRAFSAFAIIVFPLSLLATIVFVSQTGVFQPGARLTPQTPKITTSNWTPPILDNALISDGDATPTPSSAAGQQAAARLKTPTATASVIATPTQSAPPGTPFDIFADALAPGWSDQSWGASVNLASTKLVYAGLHAISYTATSGWAGLDLHAANDLDTANYRQLRFALRATRANQQFAVYLRDASGTALTKVPLANYGGDPPNGTWKIYAIPLSDLGASNITLGDVVFHEWSGKAQPAIYIDSIELISDPGMAAPTPTPPPSGPLTIYADAFASGWDMSRSWDATVNPNNGAPVYAGSKSISYVAMSAWAGLQIWNSSGVDTTRFTYLRFALHATQNSEPFAVYLRTSDYVDLTDPIPLSHHGGYPGANGWTVYTIPLADLNASDVTLSGIILHDWSDRAQPAIYVDAIELLP